MKQSIFVKTLVAAAIGLLALACTKTEDDAQLALSDKVANFEASGTLDKTIKVVSNGAWTVSCTESWVTLDPASGNGNGSFKITVSENTGILERSADVKVTAGAKTETVSVLQTGKMAVLNVSPLSFSVPEQGETKKVTITANIGWKVLLPAECTWITADKTEGENNGEVNLTFQPNDNLEARQAQITVQGEVLSATIDITQLGLNPALAVNPESLDEFSAQGGEAVVTVTANVDWTVSVNKEADWLSVTPDKENGSLKIVVSANQSFDRRSADITVEGVGNVSTTLQVNQAALVPALDVYPETPAPVANEGGTVAIQVFANGPWALSLPEEADWLSADALTGNGETTVTLTVAPNRTELKGRAATVAFKLENLEKSVTISQLEANYSRITDSLMLVKVYNVADGANWKESRRWTLTDAIDTWPGIKVNGEGRVIELSITNGTVTTVDWEFPEEIANLTELTTFQAVGSRVKGDLPEFLYDLTKLVKLVINGNNITGSLSAKVKNWDKMTDLYINNNKQFGGTLPAEIGQMSSLSKLNIAQTAIEGTIPETLVNCTDFSCLMAYDTSLTGPIPEIWDQFDHLMIIQLYSNSGLDCPLPTTFGLIKTDQKSLSLQLHGSNFTGNIPESYANLPAVCKQLRLQENRLKGVVPAAVQAHVNWATWDPAKYIFPQQEGYGLSDKSGSGGQDLDDTKDENPWE